LGRFARDYYARFGELPSHTLHRGSAGLFADWSSPWRTVGRPVEPDAIGPREKALVGVRSKHGAVQEWAQVANPAFARPSTILRTSSCLLKGNRPKCSLNEYFGLISMSSRQMRRASSISPRWPRADASGAREKSVPGTRRMRSLK